jgi:hypothetical protein
VNAVPGYTPTSPLIVPPVQVIAVLANNAKLAAVPRFTGNGEAAILVAGTPSITASTSNGVSSSAINRTLFSVFTVYSPLHNTVFNMFMMHCHKYLLSRNNPCRPPSCHRVACACSTSFPDDVFSSIVVNGYWLVGLVPFHSTIYRPIALMALTVFPLFNLQRQYPGTIPAFRVRLAGIRRMLAA